MKRIQRIISFLMVMVMAFGMMPPMVVSADETELTADSTAAADEAVGEPSEPMEESTEESSTPAEEGTESNEEICISFDAMTKDDNGQLIEAPDYNDQLQR